MPRNYVHGKFIPTKPEKYVGDIDNIVYRSSWEMKFLRWCDTQDNIIKYASEECVIPYYSQADGKQRRYFVDFVVQGRTKDGKTQTYLVEVKPEAQTKLPVRKSGKKLTTYSKEMYTYMVNQDKWKAAKAYAEAKGMKFIVMTERELGVIR